jgi:hypothetical protein
MVLLHLQDTLLSFPREDMRNSLIILDPFSFFRLSLHGWLGVCVCVCDIDVFMCIFVGLVSI